MKKCGETIAFHRKRLNLTQTELGEQLNVTAQAVSKWENDISEPDLVTVQRLCKIFGITVDELLNSAEEGETAPAEEAATEESAPGTPAAETAAAAAPAETAASGEPVVQKILAGYCHRCKRPLYVGEDYEVHHIPRSSREDLFCRKCANESRMESEKAKRRNEYSTEKKNFNRGMICGGCVGGVIAIATPIAAILAENPMLYLGFVAALVGFVFGSMMFWSETLQDIFFFFFKSFRMPGLIFSLDLDGIIWFITVKLLFGFLSGLLSVICVSFGCVFTAAISVFIFPFALAAKIVKLKKLKRGV